MVTILAAMIIICNVSFGQDKGMIVQGSSPNIFLLHTVKAKENYYSVGRMYNVAPKELAAYNNIAFEKGLSLGVSLKIPLTPNNFNQGEPSHKEEALIPLYHIVQAKEGLYRVSVTYNKVPIDNLKRWNKLAAETVSVGTKLIIGYLKVSKEQSPLALQGEARENSNNVVVNKSETTESSKNVESDAGVVSKKPNKAEVSSSQETSKTHKEESKVDAVSGTIDKPAADFSGGYFKNLYNNQTENKTVVKETGLAAVFKTTSGWSDGKYYCFHNEARPGIIMKITNNATGKFVYAKVLDAIPDIKQNGGLLIRLSNAAASELGVAESKFDCSVSYTK